MKTKDMSCFNLRLVFPCLINIYKIFNVEILAWEWDPYNIMGDLSWMKVSGLLLLFLAFSFSSIEAVLTPSKNPRFVRLCLSGQYFSISMALSLLASLIFPQEIFWVIIPLIILLSFCSPPRILNLLICLHAAASRLPGCSILITATGLQIQLVAGSQVINEGRYPVEEGACAGAGAGSGSEESEEDRDLEANDLGHHQVVMIS